MAADRPARLSLPVDAILPELVGELEQGRDVVLEATPGGGKTTRVPPALLAAKFRGDREIIVLEPRRLAAKMAARRVAEELGEQVGQTVGYQFRFENVGGAGTRIRFLTEGMFVRRLLSDPGLGRVAAVIVDEFHERHLQGDVALAALMRLKRTARPDLRLVVMSATLDVEGIAKYLGDARVIKVETRRFDVAVEYLNLGDEYLDRQVAKAARNVTADDGDVLVFLPGVAEIRRAGTALEGWAASRNALVLPLYGDLSREEQDRALRPLPGRQKIILSTNVAETSLTIDGVRTVIDSGLARVASFSHWSGLPALRTKAVSRASAIQRAGRAGRQAPGRCLRLYGKQDFETRPAFEVPEIQRADLAQTLLELFALGVRDPKTFPWFEAPLAASLDASVRLLRRLGAVDAEGALTPLGRRMAEMPTHPRLARLVLEGEKLGLAREACDLAAMLSEGDEGGLDVMAAAERYTPHGPVARARDQLLRHTKPVTAGAGPAADLRRAILVAFPDRVARKRELPQNVSRNIGGSRIELVLSSSGSALVENTAATASHEYFVTIDIEERGKTGRLCRSLCAIEPEWLFDLEPEGVREVSEVGWDAARERVTASTRMIYDGLTLAESKGEADPHAVAARLAAEAIAAGPGKFCDAEELQLLLERIRFVKTRLPDPGFPEVGEEGLRKLVEAACIGKHSFAELRSSDLASQILYSLTEEQRSKLERFAPTHAQLPAGRRVRIHYEATKDPWVESRLQDFFGMKAGPTVLGGRLALVLHLLAPNHRAVQVTADLAGFWTRIYPELRRELGRRYPRHAWPEDPHQIPPPRPPRR